MPLSVCSRTHQNSAPSEPPDPPPMRRSLRKVTASIRTIFIGSVLSMAAAIAEAIGADSEPAPRAASDPKPARSRKFRRVMGRLMGCLVLLRSYTHGVPFYVFVHLRSCGRTFVDVIERS